MSDSNLITAWNEIFDFKIKEVNLAKPTEGFLFGALVSYLKMFNIDVTKLMYDKQIEDSDCKRVFDVQFCKYIDHFYKISDKNNSFLYFDLIHPSPKKTVHMLRYLLNYYLYYNVMKNEVVGKAKEKIDEWEEVLKMKHDCERENNMLKVKAQSIEKSKAEYNTLLPKLNTKIINYKQKIKTQEEEIRHLQEAVKNCDNTISELRHTEEELRSALVSQDEVKSLKINLESLKKALKEQEDIKSATVASSKATADSINRLESIIKRIEGIMEIYPSEELLSAKNLKTAYEELEHKYAVQISENERKKYAIENYSKKKEELQRELSEKSELLQSSIDKWNKMIEELKEKLVIEEKTNVTLNEELEQLDQDIFQQHQNLELMLHLVGQMKYYFTKHA